MPRPDRIPACFPAMIFPANLLIPSVGLTSAAPLGCAFPRDEKPLAGVGRKAIRHVA